MQKAQVFLTDEQKVALKALSLHSGRKQSEIIRHGVDLAIAEAKRKQSNWKSSLMEAKGIWKDNKDIEAIIANNRAKWRKRQISILR